MKFIQLIFVDMALFDDSFYTSKLAQMRSIQESSNDSINGNDDDWM
jgi:hypothetical protein